MPFSVDRKISSAKSIEALAQTLQKLFVDLEDYINNAPSIQPEVNGQPQRNSPGDLLISNSQGNITLSLIVGENAKFDVTIGPATTSLNQNYKGLIEDTGTPTSEHFPLDGNFGWFWNGSIFWLVYNFSGLILKVQLT